MLKVTFLAAFIVVCQLIYLILILLTNLLLL